MGCSNSSSVKANAPEPVVKFHDRYKLGQKIGYGSFGQVSICSKVTSPPQVKGGRSVQSSERYAVKILNVRQRGSSKGQEGATHIPKGAVDQGLQRSVEQEKTIWEAIGDHKHVVKLYETYYDQGLHYFVMELCKASVLDTFNEGAPITPAEGLRVFYEMLLGMKHLHEQEIVHRDIKPDNFIYSGRDGTTVKICDFGLSEFVSALPLPNVVYHGTAPYMSPEMLNELGYSIKTDIWSLGVTAYLLLYGDYPYAPENRAASHMKAATRKGHPLPRFKIQAESTWLKPTANSVSFLKALLDRDPNARPNCDEALRHPLLRSTAKRLGLAEPLTEKVDEAKTLENVATASVATEGCAMTTPKELMEHRPAALRGLISPCSSEGGVVEKTTTEQGQMRKMFNMVKQRNKEYKITADALCQKSMDQLLEDEQKARYTNSKSPTSSASMPNSPTGSRSSRAAEYAELSNKDKDCVQEILKRNQSSKSDVQSAASTQLPAYPCSPRTWSDVSDRNLDDLCDTAEIPEENIKRNTSDQLRL